MEKKSIELEKYSIPGLYYKYKKTSDEEIRKFLDKVKIVKMEHKGAGSVYGYYPISDESLNKMKENPRGNSLTFDTTETKGEALMGLMEYKKFVFLVKSSSRFFLKPDIGEVFDQISFHDLMSVCFDAICVDLDNYTLLDDTQGEHFLMTAVLLKDRNKEIEKATRKLHEL